MRDWRQIFLELHQDDGVRREDIYDYLGDELRTLWNITPNIEENIDEIRRRVRRGLEALLTGHTTATGKPKSPNILNSLRISYNISGIRSLENLGCDKRQEHAARQFGEGFATSTMRRHVGAFQSYAIPEIEKRLAALSAPPQQASTPAHMPSNPVPTAPPPPPALPQPQAPPPQTNSQQPAEPPSQTRLYIAMGVTFFLLAAIVWPAAAHWRNELSSDEPKKREPTPSNSITTSGPTPSLKTPIPPDVEINAKVITLEDEPGSVMPGMFTPNSALERRMSKGMGSTDPELQRVIMSSTVKLSTLSIQIVAKGLNPDKIRITNIKPVIYSQQEPLDGTFFNIPTGQGIDSTQRLHVDLDKPEPIVRELIFPKQDGEVLNLDPPKIGEPFFLKNTISLKKGEDQTFVIQTVVTKHHVKFWLRLEYIANGEEKTEAISNNGKHFEVTGPRCGTIAGSLSYRSIYTLQGDFSVAREPNPVNMEASYPGCGG